MDPLTGTIAAYGSLSPAVQAAIAKSAAALAKAAATRGGAQAVGMALGSKEQQALNRALKKAIAEVVAARADMDRRRIARMLLRRPFREEILKIVSSPAEEINVLSIRAAFTKSGVGVGALGLDPVELVLSVGQRFLTLLRDDPTARSLWMVREMEHTSSVLDEVRRDVKSILGGARAAVSEPEGGEWLGPVVAGLYTESRRALRADRLDDATLILTSLLEQLRQPAVRELALSAGKEASRIEHEQNVLLSLAQIAFRRGDTPQATELLEEALAKHEIEPRAKARQHAGWLLLNLGRTDEALALLQPHDGSPEWRSLLGLAHLASGSFEDFSRVFPDLSLITDPDLFVGLVNYFSARGELARAEQWAKRLVARGFSAPVDEFRAVIAGAHVLGSFIEGVDPEPIDVEFWLRELRRLHEQPTHPHDRLPPQMQATVLWYRMVFYHLVLETGSAAEAYLALAELAPADAASAAASNYLEVEPEVLERSAAAARSAVEARVIQARQLLNESRPAQAAERLAEAVRIAGSGERDRVIALELEARLEAGEDAAALRTRVSEIEDPRLRIRADASLASTGGDPVQALQSLKELLSATPNDLRLLRLTYAHAREAAKYLSARGDNVDALRHETIALAAQMVARLPVPEHRIAYAKALAAAGDYASAHREVQTVVDAGYRTPSSAQLLAELARQRGLVRQYADAVEDFYRLSPSPEVGLAVARAALRVGDLDRARTVLEPLASSERREIALEAYRGLAYIAESSAGGEAVGVERAAEILMQGYDRLGAPIELAEVMFLKGLGTPLSREIHERISRDFGGLGGLPGVKSFSIDEAVETMRRDEQGSVERAKLLRAGVLPFDRFADWSPRDYAFLWFAHREGRLPHPILGPHVLAFADEYIIPDDPPPLLVDRTSLLVCVELDLLDIVLDSPLKLLIQGDTLEWLFREAQQLRSHLRPGEAERLRGRMKLIEAHPKIDILAHRPNPNGYEGLASLLNVRDAYELALAAGEGALLLSDDDDLPDLPAEWSDRITRSDDVLAALLHGGHVGLGDIAAAVTEGANGFSTQLSRTPSVLDRPLMLTSGALRRWDVAGLLRQLADAVPRLFVSPIAAQQLRADLIERNAYARALDAVEELRHRLAAALETGRVELAPVEASAFPSPDEELGEEEFGAEDDSAEQDATAFCREMTSGLEARYRSAARAEALFWADDAAAHLYLDPLGPFVTDSPEIVSRQVELRQAVPGLRVVGVSDVLAWLERQGRLSTDERVRRLADLSAHGRTFIFTGEVLAWAVQATLGPDPGDVESGREILDRLAGAPATLPVEGAARYCPTVASSVAAAITSIGGADGKQIELGVRLLLDAFRPWVDPSHPFARLNAVAFWQFLGLTLLPHVEDHPEIPLTNVLQHINTHQRDFAFLRETAASLIDGLVRSMAGLEADGEVEPAVRVLYTLLFEAIGHASAALEVDEGKAALLHPAILRLAAPIFDTEVNFTGQVVLESAAGSIAVEVDLEQAEIDAAHGLETAAAMPAGLSNSPALGVRVPVEVEYPPESGQKVVIPANVKAIHLLHRVSANVRESLVLSLRSYYELSGQADLAEIVSLHEVEVLSADAERVARGRAQLFRDLLLAPRTWLEVDLGTFFMLLHAAPLEQLRAIAGRPGPWLEGEVLSSRLLKELSATTDADAQRRSLASAWGPFGVFLSLLRDFIAIRSHEEAGEDYPRMLLQQALDETEDPYVRIFELGLLLNWLEQHPDHQGLPWHDGTTIGAVTCQLLNRLLGWVSDTAPSATEALGVSTPEEFRLHSLVHRLVFRSVLTQQHLMEAVANSEAGGDALGDLLLTGHLLTSVAFAGAAGRARTRGMEVITSELERLLTQHPLVRGSNPVSERFLPDSLGVDPPLVNPYLATLLAVLESPAVFDASLVAGPSGEEGEVAGVRVPFWWPSVREALSMIASRQPAGPPDSAESGTNLVPNRFEVIHTELGELRAARLLERYGGSPPEPKR